MSVAQPRHNLIGECCHTCIDLNFTVLSLFTIIMYSFHNIVAQHKTMHLCFLNVVAFFYHYNRQACTVFASKYNEQRSGNAFDFNANGSQYKFRKGHSNLRHVCQ